MDEEARQTLAELRTQLLEVRATVAEARLSVAEARSRRAEARRADVEGFAETKRLLRLLSEELKAFRVEYHAETHGSGDES